MGLKDDLGRPSPDPRPGPPYEFWQGMAIALFVLVIAMIVFYYVHG